MEVTKLRLWNFLPKNLHLKYLPASSLLLQWPCLEISFLHEWFQLMENPDRNYTVFESLINLPDCYFVLIKFNPKRKNYQFKKLTNSVVLIWSGLLSSRAWNFESTSLLINIGDQFHPQKQCLQFFKRGFVINIFIFPKFVKNSV